MIVLNGKAAEKYFNQAVKAGDVAPGNFTVICMPSTSPALTISIDKKLETWQKIMQFTQVLT